MTAAEIEKIKRKISSAKSILKKGKKEFGFYDDSYGRRYLIPELQIQIEDFSGVIKYYDWFYKEFPDDIGFPGLHLCWIITAIKKNKPEMLNKHLVELENVNCYIIPELLNRPIEQVEKWEGMNISTKDYAKSIAKKFSGKFDLEAIAVIEEIVGRSEYRFYKNSILEIGRKLNLENQRETKAKLWAERKEQVANWLESLNKKQELKINKS